jgi:hypothetical protein
MSYSGFSDMRAHALWTKTDTAQVNELLCKVGRGCHGAQFSSVSTANLHPTTRERP